MIDSFLGFWISWSLNLLANCITLCFLITLPTSSEHHPNINCWFSCIYQLFVFGSAHFEYFSLHKHSSWKVDSECVLFLLVIYSLDEKQKFMHKAHKANPVDTGHKLNVHLMFRRRPGHLLNVWYMFSLCPMSTGKELF